jgi:arylsulfatase
VFATLAFNNISGIGRDGTGVLIPQWDETFDVGVDTGTPVYDKTTRCRSSSPASSTS